MGAAVKPINTGASRFKVDRKHQAKSPIDKAKGYEVVWNQVSGEFGVFDAARTFEDACFIYLIGEDTDGPVKIGLSKDPISRLRSMQTGNPRRLRIEYVLIGDMPLEKLLHQFWEPFAVVSASSAGKPDALPGTEWFKPEARETLLPIIADAAYRQTQLLRQAPDSPLLFLALKHAVRDAHAENGFVAQGRDEVRLLGQTVGYAIRRRSRI
jgi:hypothetical protein